MYKYLNSIIKQICFLLLIFICVSSCKGQVKSNLSEESVSKSQTVLRGNSKLIKTQGSNQSDNIHCSLQDKAGNIWFGTTGEGVYRYDGKSFTQFTVKDGLASNKVWSILEDKAGNIWFGTTDGISRYDGKKITGISIASYIRPVISDNSYYTVWSTKNTVWSMLQDKSGRIWFGTGDGVYYFNGINFTRFLNNDGVENNDSLHLKMVDCILEDKSGNIWFASGMLPGQEGLIRFDGKSLTRFKPGGDVWIRSVMQDKNGIIWSTGRHNGNWCFDGKSFTKFTGKEGIGNPLLIDKEGNIWFSGEEKDNSNESKDGIWLYDGKTFTNFNTKDGLGNYFAYSILEDKNGNIWVGARNCELYRFDGKTFKDFSEEAKK